MGPKTKFVPSDGSMAKFERISNSIIVRNCTFSQSGRVTIFPSKNRSTTVTRRLQKLSTDYMSLSDSITIHLPSTVHPVIMFIWTSDRVVWQAVLIRCNIIHTREKKFFFKKSFECRNGAIKRTEARQRWNHKDGEEETQEECPTSVQLTIKYLYVEEM